jgi:streptogramin lyase
LKNPARLAFPALLLLLAATAGILGLPLVRASKITKYSLVGLHPTYPASGIPTGLVARDGYVYFSYQKSTAGIGRLDPATISMKVYPLPSQAGYTVIAFDLGEAYAWVLTEDDMGRNNLYALDLANGRAINWRVGSDTNGLLVENDSSIWLTGSSLDRFNPNTGEMKTYPLPCPAARCWTNSTNVFRPIWVNGNIWALLTHSIPAPNYAGEELIEIDPRTGSMAVYPMPKFFYNGQFFNEAAFDMTSDSHGNLWLMLGGVLAKFDTTTSNYEFVQSIFGGPNFIGPAACDKEGNLFFVQRNYTQSLIEYSPSSQSFTDYWTGPTPPGGTPASIQDLVVDSTDMVWFLNTYVNETLATFMDLYRLSVGGAGTTITTTASFNTTQTSMSVIPSGELTYTGSLASMTENPVSTIVLTQSTSTLEASTMTATQTLAVHEFSVYVTFLLGTLLVSALVQAKSFRYRTARKPADEG